MLKKPKTQCHSILEELCIYVPNSLNEKLKILSPGYTMEIPNYVTSWVIKRTGESRHACNLCKCEVGNTDSLRYHLKHPFHLKKVMQQVALHCSLCNLQCKYQSVYDKHIKTKAHLHKENPETIIEHKCEDCNVTFRCWKEKERHLTTKKHAKHSKTDSVSSNP